MPSRLNPYLHFKDNAREAMDFYKSVFGGDLTRSTFGEAGTAHAENEKNNIMHSQLETPAGFTLMASDTPADMGPVPANGQISLSGDNAADAELRGYWTKLLAGGGQAMMPLEKAPWGDAFGMLTDKYGVSWLVNIAGAPQK